MENLYEFAGTLTPGAGTAKAQFRKVDGTAGASPYFSLIDEAGRWLSAADGWDSPHVFSAGISATATAMTTAAGVPVYATPSGFSALPVGFYWAMIAATSAFNAAAQSWHRLYWDGAEWHEAERRSHPATQARSVWAAGPAFRRKTTRRHDNTLGCTAPFKLHSGVANDEVFAIDMAPLFGAMEVLSVGAVTIAGGELTGVPIGPVNNLHGGPEREAYFAVSGTPTLNSKEAGTVAVTMADGKERTQGFEVWAL